MTDDDVTADDGALFDVAELRLDPARRGRAEAGLMRALSAATSLSAECAGMVGAALVAARALDQAEAYPGPKTPYAVQAVMPSLIDALQALGLPARVAPTQVHAMEVPEGAAESGNSAPDWLSDALGPS